MRFKKMFIPSEGRSNYTKQGDINSTIINSGNYGGGGGFIDFTPDIEKLKDKDENLEGRLNTVETNLGEPSNDPNKSKVDGTAFERIQFNKNLIGNSTDVSTTGSLWGAVNGMEDEIYGDGTEGNLGLVGQWETFEQNWTSEFRTVKNNLGNPEDDGTTAGQTDTAFGRIAKLENGGTPDGMVSSEVLKDSSFVINSPYSDKNIQAFNLVQKYMFTQNSWTEDGKIKWNLPLWVRDYDTFDAYNVINMYPEYTEDEHHNYTLTLLTLSFIKTENNVDYEYKYSFNKNGKATQISKVEVHKDISQMETDVTDLKTNDANQDTAITNLRKDLGTKGSTDESNAFGRIAALSNRIGNAETTVATHTEQITKINTDNTTRDEKVTNLETSVGTVDDVANATGSVYARIKYNKEQIGSSTDDVTKNTLWAGVNNANDNVDKVLDEWTVVKSDFDSVKTNLGVNDIPNTTAFGRIAALEAGGGGGGGLAAISDVVEKNTFYLDASSNPDSKKDNVTTYNNMIHYVSQNPKCQVPIYIRPDKDYEGTWSAILVNPHKIDHMKWDGVDVTYCKPDYDGDKKYYLYQIFVSKDGSVTDKGKIDIEGLTKEEVQAIYDRLYNIEEKNGWQDENIDALDADVKELQEAIPHYNIRIRRKGGASEPYEITNPSSDPALFKDNSNTCFNMLNSEMYIQIENYDEDMKLHPDKYRIVPMFFKRKSYPSSNLNRRWRIPFFNKAFHNEKNTAGQPIVQPCRFASVEETYYPVKGVDNLIWGDNTHKSIAYVCGLYPKTTKVWKETSNPDGSINRVLVDSKSGCIDPLSHSFKTTNNRKMKIGFAVYKKLEKYNQQGELVNIAGQYGWNRVSNIASFTLFCCADNTVRFEADA